MSQLPSVGLQISSLQKTLHSHRHDNWGSCRFLILLFNLLCRNKDGWVKDFWVEAGGVTSWNFDFRRNLNDWEIDLFASLLEVIHDNHATGDRGDQRVWNPDPEHGFSVRTCYGSVQPITTTNFSTASVWRSIPPLKVIFAMWAACLSKVPTIDSLQKRGRSLANRCELCGMTEETCCHLLLHCRTSWAVWAFITESFNIQWCIPQTVEQVMLIWPTLKLPTKGKRLWLALLQAIIWSIWKTRNNAIFKEERVVVGKIIILLKGFVFSWSRYLDWAKDYRFKHFVFKWEALLETL